MFFRNISALRTSLTKTIFKNIVRTCRALSERNIFHRDIKDENILLDTFSLETNIIDFGCAIFATPTSSFSSFSGTVDFAPPEVHLGDDYLPESTTIWTLGIVLYVLIFAAVPFDTIEDILSGRRKFDESHLSQNLQNLLDRLFDLDPLTRCTFDELLSSDWLTSG